MERRFLPADHADEGTPDKTKPPLPPKPEIIEPIEVFYFDTDAGGVVHNVAYLRMVEVARSRLAEALGWSLGEMQRTGIVPVVVRTEIDYLKPARLGEKLQIRAWLDQLQSVRFILGFEMTRPADGAVLVRCRQTMATVDLKTGRPLRAPEAWQKAYGRMIGAN